MLRTRKVNTCMNMKSIYENICFIKYRWFTMQLWCTESMFYDLYFLWFSCLKMAFAEINCLYIAQWKTFLPLLALFLSLIHPFSFFKFLYFISHSPFYLSRAISIRLPGYPHYGLTVSKHSFTSIFLWEPSGSCASKANYYYI